MPKKEKYPVSAKLGLKLPDLSLFQLDALASEAKEAIAAIRDNEKKAAIRKIRALAASSELDVSDILTAQSHSLTTLRTPRSPSTAKYRNPANYQETWSGVGRQPRWLVTYLANGGHLEDTKIQHDSYTMSVLRG